jgi:DeoR/GlpR family transcriptional regulator of sugar metabolism
MNNLSSSVNSSLEWRRSKVQELSSQGYNQSEISRILQISQPTINRDLAYLRNQAKANIRKYIDERLPEEYEKCLVGLIAILREAWTTSQQTEDKREKMQALSLAKECYSMKLDLLTNATVVDDAIRFVSQKTKEKTKSIINSNSIEDDTQDQQKEKTVEITQGIKNEVFYELIIRLLPTVFQLCRQCHFDSIISESLN